jgi:hypothetical protein
MDDSMKIKDPLIVEHANSIAFIAEYEDGSEDYFRIDRYALSPGDHIAGIVAREWQKAGRLRPGKIVRVYRDPKVSYIG